MQAVGQFGPNGPPPTRYEIGDTFIKKRGLKNKKLDDKIRRRMGKTWMHNYDGCLVW